MARTTRLTSILLNICSQGCMIVVGDPKSIKKSACIFELLHYLPRGMIFVSNSAVNTNSHLTMKGIDAIRDIHVSPDYPTYYYLTGPIGIKIYTKPSHPEYHLNHISIEKLVHFSYEGKAETPTSKQLESYWKKMWNLMYNECFNTTGILYLSICDNYLVPDIKTKIINELANNILITKNGLI